MSVKAMWMMIQKIHAESHVSRLFILCDMVWCAVHYGVGYLEYRVFGWVSWTCGKPLLRNFKLSAKAIR